MWLRSNLPLFPLWGTADVDLEVAFFLFCSRTQWRWIKLYSWEKRLHILWTTWFNWLKVRKILTLISYASVGWEKKNYVLIIDLQPTPIHWNGFLMLTDSEKILIKWDFEDNNMKLKKKNTQKQTVSYYVIIPNFYSASCVWFSKHIVLCVLFIFGISSDFRRS